MRNTISDDDPTIDVDFACTRDELEETVKDAGAFAEGIEIIDVDGDEKIQIEEIEYDNAALRAMPVKFSYYDTFTVRSDSRLEFLEQLNMRLL